MIPNFKKHPIFTHAQTIADICDPLQYLNIHHFCYLHMNHNGERSWIATTPKFTEHYLDKKYYETDVHNASVKPEKYMLYDQQKYRGKTQELVEDASLYFDLKQFFMISRENQNGIDYYHFATKSTQDMSYTYFSHILELNQFVDYFHDKLKISKTLQAMSKFKIETKLHHDNWTTVEKPSVNLTAYQEALDEKSFLKSTLSAQQIKCLEYLSKGYSAKETAAALSLSYRTVEDYLDRVRQKLVLKNKYELRSGSYPGKKGLNRPSLPSKFLKSF